MSSFQVNGRHFFAIIFSALLFIIAVLSYFFAPIHYSNHFCIFLMIVYLVTSLFTIRFTLLDRNYFNFHVFFLISFFFVNFVYPVFIYPVNPLHFSVYKYAFNHDIISRATAMALLGACSYNFGAILGFTKKAGNTMVSDTNYNTLLFLLTNLVYVISAVVLIFAGAAMLKGNFGSSSTIPAGLLVIFEVSIGLAVILVVIKRTGHQSLMTYIWKFNKPILFLLAGFILLFIYTGDRGPVLQVLLISIGGYSLFINPIKLKTFVIGTLLAMLIFTFISYARSPDVTSKHQEGISRFIARGSKNIKLESFFDLGMDLIINNRNLYVGIDYAEKHGFTYGKSMFYNLFAPVPYLPTLMTKTLFNSLPSDLTSATIITKEAKLSWGLGTNVIADLYMAFGIPAVILFMFLLGKLVTRFQLMAFSGKNPYSIITYLFLVGFSVYLPRTSVLEPLRHIIWALLLFGFLKITRSFLLQISGKPETA